MKMYDCVSPLDFRYYGADEKMFYTLGPYVSEGAALKYQLAVEKALIDTLVEVGLCPKPVAREVAAACKTITPQEIIEEEARIKHNVRALVNCIRNHVSDKAKPYVHLTATSNDIISTADSMRLRDACLNVVIPHAIKLEKALIALAKKEASTVQIGRTHGQHAEPITVGFAIAEYIDRLGGRILALYDSAYALRGKFSGAVGAYNASSLLIKDPAAFEVRLLAKLDLKPARHATQIVQPEYAADVHHVLATMFGVLANLSDDMRHLQRSEIGEIAEEFGRDQVGSSTMPHKRNPINFENVKSMWKAFMPRMVTVYMDQISEHQRDLTNSASSRFMFESVVALTVSIDRLTKVMNRVVVDRENLKANISRGLVVAEPLYILLAQNGHPDAHEAVRKLTLSGGDLGKKIFTDSSLKKYLVKCTPRQIAILKDPSRYIGLADKKAKEICGTWDRRLTDLK